MSRNINLYDPSLRLQKDYLTLDFAVSIVITAIVCVALAVWMMQSNLAELKKVAGRSAADLSTQQSSLKAIADQVAGAKPDPALQSEITSTQRTLVLRRAALQSLRAGSIGRNHGYSAHLAALARQTIEGVWLTGVTLHRDDVMLLGRSLRPALIPAYIQRLEHEPALQGRGFKALEVSRPLEERPKLATQVAAVMPPISASAPSDVVEGEAAPPRHAEFVDFKLTGSGQDDPAATGTTP